MKCSTFFYCDCAHKSFKLDFSNWTYRVWVTWSLTTKIPYKHSFDIWTMCCVCFRRNEMCVCVSRWRVNGAVCSVLSGPLCVRDENLWLEEQHCCVIFWLMIKLMNIYTSLSTCFCDRYVKRNQASEQTTVKKIHCHATIQRKFTERKNKHFALV